MSGSIDIDDTESYPTDWESRRWQAAVAAMNAFAIKHIDFGSMESMADCAVRYADALIAEYRKQEKSDAR